MGSERADRGDRLRDGRRGVGDVDERLLRERHLCGMLAQGNFDEAAAKLNWIIEKGGHPEYDTVARVRLAGVYFDAGKLDDALKVLEGAKPADGQKASVADRRGDVLRAKGDAAGAKKAYEEALASAEANDPLRRLIELKLGSLPAA